MISFDLLARFAFEYQELNIHLDVVARHPLVVAFRMHLSTPHLARQATNTVPFEDSVNGGIGNAHLMVARHVPNDPDWSKMIFLP
ncbi:MAG: hypothetical protein ACI9UU_003224 [Candidatus Azotimanducaceae bacterium]